MELNAKMFVVQTALRVTFKIEHVCIVKIHTGGINLEKNVLHTVSHVKYQRGFAYLNVNLDGGDPIVQLHVEITVYAMIKRVETVTNVHMEGRV